MNAGVGLAFWLLIFRGFPDAHPYVNQTDTAYQPSDEVPPHHPPQRRKRLDEAVFRPKRRPRHHHQNHAQLNAHCYKYDQLGAAKPQWVVVQLFRWTFLRSGSFLAGNDGKFSRCRVQVFSFASRRDLGLPARGWNAMERIPRRRRALNCSANPYYRILRPLQGFDALGYVPVINICTVDFHEMTQRGIGIPRRFVRAAQIVMYREHGIRRDPLDL